MSAAVTQSPAVQQVYEVHASARSTMKIKLTRRGRVVLGTMLVAVAAGVLALVASFFAPQAIASDVEGEVTFGYVVAAPGASLWQLATEIDPSMDPRDLVAEIVHLNQLQGADIVVGQPIAVPLRYNDSSVVMSAADLGL